MNMPGLKYWLRTINKSNIDVMTVRPVRKANRHPISIQTQLLLGTGVILMLASIIAINGYLSLQTLQAGIQATLEKAEAIREYSIEVENEFLLARQDEYRFLIGWRSSGFSAAIKYVTANQSHFIRAQTDLEHLADQIRTTNDPTLQLLTDQIDELRPLLNTYATTFETAVAEIEKRSRRGGLENQLRDHLDQLEVTTLVLPNPEFHQLIVQIRAAEEAYLGTARQEYVDKVHLLINKLIAVTQTSAWGDPQSTTSPDTPGLIDHANYYLTRFDELVALDRNLEIKTTVFLEVSADIDRITNSIRDQSEAGLERARTRLDSVSKQVMMTLSLITVLALVLGVLAAIRLARQIIQPLRQLSQAAEQMGTGNLRQTVAVNGAYELVVLADAFNGMAAQLHNLINSLEQRVQERTAELASTNQTLQIEIAERKTAEEQLLHESLHDALTALTNRVLFKDRLAQALKSSKREPQHLFAVFFIDLDRFKVINDSLGHHVGDQLLIQVARRLEACFRATDTIARLGGDEFAILVENIQHAVDARRAAQRVQNELGRPFLVDHHELSLSASIGIALSRRNDMSSSAYTTPEEILRDADTAMYSAKASGKACYVVFDVSMHSKSVALLKLETDLRQAIERQEFSIYYQPIISLETNHIVGFEALVRWRHPNRGLVSPAEFIPMAEETGLIVPIGKWVLHEACCQMREWQLQFPQEPPLTISVNLSTKQFNQADLLNQVTATLRETGLDAHSLKLELTESLIVEDSQAMVGKLEQLRALGVQVQIDDFGTGYSSLGYLHRLPIDTLKIDRTFISKIGIGVNGNGSEIVRTILALAHELGMQVIAEGVETVEQVSTLKGMACEYGQGYYFAKPVDSRTAGAMVSHSCVVQQTCQNFLDRASII